MHDPLEYDIIGLKMTKKTSRKKIVVLGITSGIAAYKMVDFIKLLKKEGVDIEVVMTSSAARMINPKDIEKVSGKKVYGDLFEKDFNYKNILKNRKVDHINLADRADVIIIAPATANIIAKIAHGIADDFLTTMVLACNSPIILSPSMNVHMWQNPTTQENIVKLKKRGFIIVPPEKGLLACGYEGSGRLPHLEKIRDEALRQITYSQELIGKKVLITAGGTIERIDDARVITNRSSGKMGIAIAEECHLRGADVLLLRAVSSVEPRYSMRTEVFETASELSALVKKYIGQYDAIFHVAAVSDFKPIEHPGKLSSGSEFALRLIPTQKIISMIKKWNPKIKLIGFKAVPNTSEKDFIDAGKNKLQECNADAIIVNDISRSDRGFGADTNEVIVIFGKGSVVKISLRSKGEIANELIAVLQERKIL